MSITLLHGWPVIAAGGFLVGFLVGMTGVGAGSLMTPFLISVIGVTPPVAVGTDLLFASITKASAAFRHNRLGNVDWGIVKYLASGSLPGALGMIAWLTIVKPDMTALSVLIRSVLSVALVISAAAILLYPWLLRRRAGQVHPPVGGQSTAGAALATAPLAATPLDTAPLAAAPPTRAPVRPWQTVALGLLLGSLVALSSVGAGAIGVVVLSALYPALATRRLVGTDIVHAIPLTFVSGVSHLGLGNVDLEVLLALLVGSVPGIALGSRLTGVIPDWLLRTALACTLLYASYALAHEA